MSFDAHKNFAYSTVATAPSPATSGTSLVVASGDGAKFPAVPFNATVWPANAQPTTANAEIVRVTGISTDTLTITRAQESSSARAITVGDQIAATITAKTVTDVENAIPTSLPPSGSAGGDLTGTYPNPTLAAAGPGATGPLGDATHVPVVTIDAKGRVTGLTSTTITATGLTADVHVYGSAGGTWSKPSGAKIVEVVCIGAGGGGGGGASSVSTGKSGGGGGGGGAVTRAVFQASDVGSSVTVTVGTGGSGGGGGAAGAGANGSNGTQGGNTTFGSLLMAGGGGSGGAGASGAHSAGGGGGSAVNQGGNGNGTGGVPNSSTAIGSQAAQGGSGGGNGTNSEWGGAGGGSDQSGAAGHTGGSSMYGGPAGGSGGGSTNGNVQQVGGAGGTTQSYAAGGGGGGASSGGANNGTDGTSLVGPYCGSGGGGGGNGNAPSAGGNGGKGGIGAGGGGGAAGQNSASGSNAGGTGGNGGDGRCIVTTYF